MPNPGERIERLLTPLRELIVNRPPFVSGTLKLPASSFSLFYKTTKDGHAARHIDLAHASSDELEQLAQACEPTAFGVGDETSVKARTMDVGRFAPMFEPDRTSLEKIIRVYHSELEGFQAKSKLRFELLNLNVYGQGSFSNFHVYPPPRERRVGSLIIVFPTPHEGGIFRFKHENNEWPVDYGSKFVAAREPSIGYVAFFGNVPHGVTQVKSGYCVTLTYELFFYDLETVRRNDLAAEGRLSVGVNERDFREKFEELVESPEFLPDGGTLGFGLRHAYPIKDNIEHVYGLLKGSDAVVYRGARALGFEPLLYVLYEWKPPNMDCNEGGLLERLIDFPDYDSEDDADDGVDIMQLIRREGGIVVCQDPDSYKTEYGAYNRPETVEWVTPETNFNERESTFPSSMGNEPMQGCVYANLCLVVRIGKAGERLAYPTSAQLRRVCKREGEESPRDFWERNRH
ncbi:hypothetical protein BC827DRAFT_1272992 [Russula dissimulans]|nr:hypothetical protein BC827DRAFT_1272992 [Russula dissimulans]